jgi:hypothetical protein
MHFPNIQIITNSKNIYFCVDRGPALNTDRYDYLRDYYNLNNNTAIVILSQLLSKYKNVIKYIKEKNISKIYFFIDDFFRCNLENSFRKIDKKYEELDIIKKIIKKTNLKEYKIFHCEMCHTPIKKLNLNYADLFLNSWTKKIRSQDRSFEFKYKASCLNRRGDIHRHLISAFLCKNTDVFLTLNTLLSFENIFKNASITLNNFNKTLKHNILNNLEYLDTHKAKFLDKRNTKGVVPQNCIHDQFVYKTIRNSFVNIVTETTFTTDNFFITEKTIKPIQCFRPFIILSTAGTLDQLKQFGFKTFSQWWDESYDDEPDHTKRFEKICSVIEDVLLKSDHELSAMLHEMSEILDHNYNNLNNLEKFLLPK